jgi:hypothetical protein
MTEDHLEQSHQNGQDSPTASRLGFGAKRAMAISRLEKMAKISTARVASVKAERTRVHEHFDRCSKENRAEEDEN